MTSYIMLYALGMLFGLVSVRIVLGRKAPWWAFALGTAGSMLTFTLLVTGFIILVVADIVVDMWYWDTDID